MSTSLIGLDDVRALIAAEDPTGQLVPCELGQLVVGPNALTQLTSCVAAFAPAGRRAHVVLLVDETVIHREGSDVKAVVAADLSNSFDLTTVVLSDGHPELHVSEPVVQAALDGSEGADVVVALGGGTISDIGKLVVAERPGLRIVTVMTAASVDGYTDNVSVILRDGVKRTIPSCWPDVVLADAETVAEAPSRMNRAGYGEMTSMYVAPADWRLAALLGIDLTYHRGPVALLEALGPRLDACAGGVATGEPQAVQELTWALALRGIATGVAGTTACLSGVEHLVSHMLDVRAAQLHLPTGLHGEQVGVGSVIAAAAWELLFERLAADPSAHIHSGLLHPGAAELRVREAFEPLNPRIADECWRDYGRKLERVADAMPTIVTTLTNWAQVSDQLANLLRSSRSIASGLIRAGAPAQLSDLDVDEETALWAVGSCALMRDRFTVVDLLTLLGWWQPADVHEVLRRAEKAVTSGLQLEGVR